MPHVSKKKPDGKTEEKLTFYLKEAFSDYPSKFRKSALEELLTNTEKIMLAKRMLLVLFIKQGVSTHKISSALKMSPSTVAKFEVRYSQNKFSNTARWIKNSRVEQKIIKPLLELISIPFEARKKSTYRIFNE